MYTYVAYAALHANTLPICMYMCVRKKLRFLLQFNCKKKKKIACIYHDAKIDLYSRWLFGQGHVANRCWLTLLMFVGCSLSAHLVYYTYTYICECAPLHVRAHIHLNYPPRRPAGAPDFYFGGEMSDCATNLRRCFIRE